MAIFMPSLLQSRESQVYSGQVRRHSPTSILFLVAGVVFTFSACRSNKMILGSDPSAKSASLPTALDSKDVWDHLSPEARLDILDSEYRSYGSLTLTEYKAPGALTNPQEKAFAEKMIGYVKSTTDLRIEDKTHGQVGSLQVLVRMLVLKEDTLLGGDVRFFQKGCVTADFSAPSFATESQAKKAGCEVSEKTAWVATGKFNYDGVPFAVSDYIEWIGD